MPGDLSWPAVDPLRMVTRSYGRAFITDRRGLVGRLDAVLDYAGPVAYGLAAHLAACRLTFVMRWLKTDDGPCGEDDLIG